MNKLNKQSHRSTLAETQLQKGNIREAGHALGTESSQGLRPAIDRHSLVIAAVQITSGCSCSSSSI